MNKTNIKKKSNWLKEKKSDILGLTAFFVALFFLIMLGSAGFYW